MQGIAGVSVCVERGACAGYQRKSGFIGENKNISAKFTIISAKMRLYQRNIPFALNGLPHIPHVRAPLTPYNDSKYSTTVSIPIVKFSK